MAFEQRAARSEKSKHNNNLAADILLNDSGKAQPQLLAHVAEVMVKNSRYDLQDLRVGRHFASNGAQRQQRTCS